VRPRRGTDGLGKTLYQIIRECQRGDVLVIEAEEILEIEDKIAEVIDKAGPIADIHTLLTLKRARKTAAS